MSDRRSPRGQPLNDTSPPHVEGEFLATFTSSHDFARFLIDQDCGLGQEADEGDLVAVLAQVTDEFELVDIPSGVAVYARHGLGGLQHPR